MNLPNFLQKLAPVGVAAIGAIALTGISTAPVQAVGTLGFSNGATDFYEDVKPGEINGVNDMFTVIFSPDESHNPLGDNLGSTLVSTASGHFVPPFAAAPPNNLVELVPVEANFEWVPGSGTGDTFQYELLNNITFDFPNEGVTVTWHAGSLFNGAFNDDNGVGFVGIEGNPDPIVTGISSTTVIADQLIFEDILPVGGATYGASVSTSVPEPTAVLGLLAFGGLGLGMKRKQEKK